MAINRRKVLRGSIALGVAGLAGNSIMASETEPLWVPPEEDKHELTFMQWPVSRKVHPDRYFLKMLQQTIADIANSIAKFEPVIMLADESFHTKARKKLSSKVELWDVATEDLWCRDSGPLFAKANSGKTVVSHIQFNGWGRKQVHKYDGKIANQVANRLGIRMFPSGLQGEAGGVEHDGHGLLTAHESSWVNNNRNPGQTRDEIEQKLIAAYGAERMIWSPGVWGEDITDYHIDSLARFTGPGRVLINLPNKPDSQDPFHNAALDTYDGLVAAGVKVDVILEPDYRRVKATDFVASYANYYACNGAIIAAEFGDKAIDTEAVAARS